VSGANEVEGEVEAPLPEVSPQALSNERPRIAQHMSDRNNECI
jgi:hypothetical protein